LIQAAFEDLSQSLRVLLEAVLRSGKLMTVDRAEAVGNIENGLTGALNSFHSLYDAVKKGIPDYELDWYSMGPLALVLAIRNARHHNKANKIRTLFTYYVQEANTIGRMERFVLVDFPGVEEGSDTMDVHLSWQDLKWLLQMPQRESRLRPSTCRLIEEFLRSDRFASYSQYYGLPEARVFFNVVPILVAAGAAMMPSLSKYVEPASIEAETFANHFMTVQPADMEHPEVTSGPIALPE